MNKSVNVRFDWEVIELVCLNVAVWIGLTLDLVGIW